MSIYKFYNIFFIYFIFLFFGPLKYIGKIPFSFYNIVFFILFIIISVKIFYKKNMIVFSYLKMYLIVMITFCSIYIFKIYNSSYIVSLRDFIIIFSPLYYLILVILMVEVFKYNDLSKTLIKFNLYIMALMGVISIFQIFHILNMQELLVNYYGKLGAEERLEYLYWHPRATAVFNLEPNTFGLYMTISLLMFHMFRKELKINILVSFIIYLFGIIGLLLSGSFTALITYIIITFIYLIKYKKVGIKVIFSLIMIGIFLISFFSENIEQSLKRQHIRADNLIPSSLMYRIENRWSKVFEDFSKNPIVGIGPAAIQLNYTADNDFLDKFLRYGMIGGTIYILFFLYLIFYPLYKRNYIKDRLIKKQLFYSSMLALSFALASLTGSAMKAKRLAELFWIFYSIPFVKIYLLKERRYLSEE